MMSREGMMSHEIYNKRDYFDESSIAIKGGACARACVRACVSERVAVPRALRTCVMSTKYCFAFEAPFVS